MNRSELSPVNEWNNCGKIADRQSDYTRAPGAQSAPEMPDAVLKTAEPSGTREGDIEKSTQPNQES